MAFTPGASKLRGVHCDCLLRLELLAPPPCAKGPTRQQHEVTTHRALAASLAVLAPIVGSVPQATVTRHRPDGSLGLHAFAFAARLDRLASSVDALFDCVYGADPVGVGRELARRGHAGARDPMTAVAVADAIEFAHEAQAPAAVCEGMLIGALREAIGPAGADARPFVSLLVGRRGSPLGAARLSRLRSWLRRFAWDTRPFNLCRLNTKPSEWPALDDDDVPPESVFVLRFALARGSRTETARGAKVTLAFGDGADDLPRPLLRVCFNDLEHGSGGCLRGRERGARLGCCLVAQHPVWGQRRWPCAEYERDPTHCWQVTGRGIAVRSEAEPRLGPALGRFDDEHAGSDYDAHDRRARGGTAQEPHFGAAPASRKGDTPESSAAVRMNEADSDRYAAWWWGVAGPSEVSAILLSARRYHRHRCKQPPAVPRTWPGLPARRRALLSCCGPRLVRPTTVTRPSPPPASSARPWRVLS